MIETLITLAAIALIVWLFWRQNGRSGKRAVGAHVFLSELDAGKPLDEAREAGDAASANPTKTMIHRTYERIQIDHQGRAARLIKAAEKRGFRG